MLSYRFSSSVRYHAAIYLCHRVRVTVPGGAALVMPLELEQDLATDVRNRLLGAHASVVLLLRFCFSTGVVLQSLFAPLFSLLGRFGKQTRYPRATAEA